MHIDDVFKNKKKKKKISRKLSTTVDILEHTGKPTRDAIAALIPSPPPPVVSYLVGDIRVAYALVENVRNRALFHLLKMEIVNDKVVRVEKDTEDFRGIKLTRIIDDAMSDV